MSVDRRIEAAEAFWRDPNGRNEQGEVIAGISARLKFRPKSVVTLPVDRKAKYLVGLPIVSELVAARILVAYHIEYQRPMMAAFMDALGIAHEDGLISDEQVQPPGEAKLREAAVALAISFPSDDVALYLSTLTWQDPDAWGALADVPESRIVAQT
jgi:hypothetical protein